MPPGTNYELFGETGTVGNRHPFNHYGYPALNQALINLADKYAEKYPGFKLYYNDMMLPMGGMFDCGRLTTWIPWQDPHKGHHGMSAAGTNVDLGVAGAGAPHLPILHRNTVNQMIEAVGLHRSVNHGDHWHLQPRNLKASPFVSSNNQAETTGVPIIFRLSKGPSRLKQMLRFKVAFRLLTTQALISTLTPTLSEMKQLAP